MLSRAEVRVLVEHTLRGVVITGLAAMLWQSLREPTHAGNESVKARGVGDLADWSTSPSVPALHVQVDSVPESRERAWLAAVAGAGTPVSWSGNVPAVLIDARPAASPTGGTRVLVAAPRGSAVILSDDVGLIDTVPTQLAGVRLALGSAAGQLSAHVGSAAASTAQRDSATLRRILVIGGAGWESKFVVAALEEAGWKVDAVIHIAPGVDVTPGSAAVIDTSRYSAVIALDGAAGPYASRIIQFARTGGGVVLTRKAASIDALAALRAGAVGRSATTDRPNQAPGSVTLASIPFTPITPLRSDAVGLERRAGGVASAARRNGIGRVVQLGHEDTWRWRMDGAEGAARDHRLWWTEVVGSVAYAPIVPRQTTDGSSDEAPMTGLVNAIGPGMPASSIAGLTGDSSDSMSWLLVLLALGLIGEVASRRSRGVS